MILLSLFCITVGFALFGLAMDDHHQKRLGRRPSSALKHRMRICAYIALVVSTPFAVISHGWIFGPVVWSGAIMLGAATVFVTLNFLPARIVAHPRHKK
jgi:hypothetical protein